MRSALGLPELSAYVARQATQFFPDAEVRPEALSPYVGPALERLAACLGAFLERHLRGAAAFDHLHTDHYAAFLYLLANTLHRRGGDRALATKLYALNKALHALDVYFEVELPEVFYFQHPVGTVLGRARYGNFLVVYQRCTVGGKDGAYPTLGEGVVLYGGSVLVGGCRVGSNVALSAGALVIEQDIPDNSVVFGASPALTVKPAKRRERDRFFRPGADRG
jgi:serine O-acetyltransferase